MIFCFDTVSGAHFNPCVTLAFLLCGEIGIIKAILYALCQFAAASAAAGLVYLLVPDAMCYKTTLICSNNDL